MPTQLEKQYPRIYFAKDFDPQKEAHVFEAYNRLLSLPTSTEKELISFLSEWSEFSSILDEASAIAYVNMTCNTKDEKADAVYKHFIEKIYPICQEKENLVTKKILSSSALEKIDPMYYGLFAKQLQVDEKLFRQENIELITKDSLLSQEYQKITGSWMVEFDGKKQTVQQMQVYQENPDRSIRESSYRARVQVHLDDAEKLDDLFDEMIQVRQKIARNAGYSNYRDYKFAAYYRFDYTPDDCLRLHDAIAETIVPLISEWVEEKKKKLDIDTYRPWDLYVDPDSHGVIKAFDSEEEFCEKVGKIFQSVHPIVGQYFQYMRDHKLLDLTSREGKAPGGYMIDMGERRVPFIFMNAVGTKRDVDTLLHEGGHSFHTLEARDQILKTYRSSPLEFAEVASMSMELLGRPYFDYVYKPEDVKAVRREQLVKIVEFFPFMSMIDSFQHWVYTTEKNGREERGLKWQELNKKFQPFLDMSELAFVEKTRWQYPHVFTVPFYYIEYGIAQIGALQVWKNSLENPKKAVEDYLQGLALGGSLPLPQLFSKANIRFSMDKKMLTELVETIKKEI